MSDNYFARRNRAAKLGRLLAQVPHPDSARGIAAVADRLAAFTPLQRRVFAIGCGCSEPSETTWRLLVDAARARKAPRDMMPLGAA